MSFPILSYILLTPVIALFMVLLIPGKYETLIKLISLLASVITLILSLIVCRHFDAANPAFQMIEHVE